MSDSIIDGTQIDTSVFSYTAPKLHAASGSRVVNLFNKNFKESLTISTPLMLCWGAQEGKTPEGDLTGKWTVSLQFPSEEYSTEDQEQFLTCMKAVEAKIKEDALSHSKVWFGKEIKSADVMEEKFNPMLKYPKISKGSVECDYTKSPTLSVKIPKWGDVWKPEIYNEDGEPLFVPGRVNADNSPIEYLPSKSRVMCLLQCGGLWFVNGKCSVTWNLKQAVVKNPKQVIEGVCFLKPKASDREALKQMPHPDEDEVLPIDNSVSVVQVDDSDDDNDDDTANELKPAELTNPDPDPQPVQQAVAASKKATGGRKPKAK
jgi:hypothetical protein